ncbi:hypothetical protein PoB_006190900 [Plakobranchus ocellatus]|uniref:Uncharacterized protein n=1 Tax=Plakobranchus ocellatus TaxID=259542 RepID=A0AAV4CU29_9GAST|nr:hypothetical protein PoB_006190900 [Plakobranchus ocellatus]
MYRLFMVPRSWSVKETHVRRELAYRDSFGSLGHWALTAMRVRAHTPIGWIHNRKQGARAPLCVCPASDQYPVVRHVAVPEGSGYSHIAPVSRWSFQVMRVLPVSSPGAGLPDVIFINILGGIG